nr:hypothetical protein Iba_chr06aCG14660 [Ipomoea batatas]
MAKLLLVNLVDFSRFFKTLRLKVASLASSMALTQLCCATDQESVRQRAAIENRSWQTWTALKDMASEMFLNSSCSCRKPSEALLNSSLATCTDNLRRTTFHHHHHLQYSSSLPQLPKSTTATGESFSRSGEAAMRCGGYLGRGPSPQPQLVRRLVCDFANQSPICDFANQLPTGCDWFAKYQSATGLRFAISQTSRRLVAIGLQNTSRRLVCAKPVADWFGGECFRLQSR